MRDKIKTFCKWPLHSSVMIKDEELDDRWATSNQLFKTNSTWSSSSCSFLNQKLGVIDGNGHQ